MFKKLFFICCVSLSGLSFADTPGASVDSQSGDLVVNPTTKPSVEQTVDAPPSKIIQNPANVGSRVGSNQLFGNPPVTGKTGEKYYTREERAQGQNRSNVGSKVGSNQVFGNPPVTGDKGQKYYTSQQLENPINSPSQPSTSRFGSGY